MSVFSCIPMATDRNFQISDSTGVRVSNFVKIGPEMAEEIGDKGEKCRRMPVSILSHFSNRMVNYQDFSIILL